MPQEDRLDAAHQTGRPDAATAGATAGSETSREVNLPRARRRPTPAFRLARPSLTASSMSGNPDQNAGGRGLRRLHQEWQVRALRTYHEVGEAWYPAQFYARSLSKTRYFPAILSDRGDPEEVEDGPLVDLFGRIRSPGGGGRNQLAYSYGLLQFLNADGYLVVSEDDGEEAWEYLSVVELRVDPSVSATGPQKYQRLSAPGAQPDELVEAQDSDFAPIRGKNVRVWRLWRPDPMHSQLADSPMRAVLDLYELLHRLTLAAGAEASSRAAQRGLVYIANELSNAGQVQGPSDDPEQDPLMRAFVEGLVNAIENPGSAAAMSPFLLRGPGAIQTAGGSIPIKDLVGWIALGPSDRYTEGEMWEKTIQRIGNGLDLPVEYVTGTAQVNHWGAWLIDEQGYRQHVAPVTENFCADLASAYLRPAARAENFPDWERVVVGYDPAEAILHPDRVAAAKDAHDRFIVSDEYYRDAIGADDGDAPKPAELERRIKVALKEDPGIGGPPQTRQPAGQPADQQPSGETPPQDGGSGGDTTEAPPAEPSSSNGQPAGITASALQQAKIIGAAELQVERARERAGASLRRRSQSCSECMERINMVPQALVAAALGRDTVLDVIDGHASEQDLIGGISAGFANKLREWGVDGEWPKRLGILVEEHAVRTLYEATAPPLPPAFAAAVAKALR
jgi:hypothetical protein